MVTPEITELTKGGPGGKLNPNMIDDDALPLSKLDAAARRRVPPDPASATTGHTIKVSTGASGSRTWVIAAETAGATPNAVTLNKSALTSGDDGGIIGYKDGTADDWVLIEWATRNGFGVSYDSSNDTFTIFVPQHLHDLLLQYGAGGWTRVAGAVAQTTTASLESLATVAGYTYSDFLSISTRQENRYVYLRLAAGTSLVAKRRQARIGEQDGVTGEFAGFDSSRWTLIGTTGGQTYYGQLAADLPAGDSVTLVEDDPASLNVRTPAELTTVDASGFSGNLSGTDTDVQTALATIDGFTLGGGGGGDADFGWETLLDYDPAVPPRMAPAGNANQLWECPTAFTRALAAADDDDILDIRFALTETTAKESGGLIWSIPVRLRAGDYRTGANSVAAATNATAAWGVMSGVSFSTGVAGRWVRVVVAKGPNGRAALIPLGIDAVWVQRLQVRLMDVTGGGAGQTGQQIGDSGILTDLSIGQNQIADSVWAAISPLDDLDAVTTNGQMLAIVQSRHAGFGMPYNELTQYPVRVDAIPLTVPPTLPGVVEDTSRDAFISRFLRFTAAAEGFRLDGLTAAGSAITWEGMAFIRPRAVGTQQVLFSFPASATTSWDIVLDTDGRLKPMLWNGTTRAVITGSTYSAGAVLANDTWYVVSVKLEGQNTSGQFRMSFGQGTTAELSTRSDATAMRSAAFNGVQWLAVGCGARDGAAGFQGDMAWLNVKSVARGTGVTDALNARQTAQAAITGASLDWDNNDAPFGRPWLVFGLVELDLPKYRYAPGPILAGGGATGFAVPDDTANSFVSVDIPDLRKSDTYALVCDISIDGGVSFQFRDTIIPLYRMGVKSIATMGTFDADSSYIVCQAGGYGGRWGGQPASNATTNRLGCNLVARAGDEIIDRVAFKAIAAESVPTGGWRVGNLRPIALRR